MIICIKEHIWQSNFKENQKEQKEQEIYIILYNLQLLLYLIYLLFINVLFNIRFEINYYYDDYEDDEFEDLDDIDYSKKSQQQNQKKRQSRQQSQKSQKTISFQNPDNKSTIQQKSNDRSQVRELSVSREKQNILNKTIDIDLKNQNDTRPCQISVFGAVDSGKSTVFGNLYQSIYKQFQNNDKPYAQIFDNTQYEQESGKTTQVCNYLIEIEKQQFILQDCPGHANLYDIIARNQIYCDGCVLVVDGVNYKRQLNQIQDLICLITIQKVKHVLIVINKMDKLEYQRTQYQQICDKISKIFKQLNSGVINMKLQFVPVCGNNTDESVSNIIKSSNQMGYSEMCLKDALLQINKKINHLPLQIYEEQPLIIQVIDNEIIGSDIQCICNIIYGIVQKDQILYDQKTNLMYQVKQIQLLDLNDVEIAISHQIVKINLILFRKNIENNNGLKPSTELVELQKNQILLSVKDLLNNKCNSMQQVNRLKIQLYTNSIIEINDILSLYIANTYVEGKIIGIEAIYSQKGFEFTDKYFVNKNQIAAVDVLLTENVQVSLDQLNIYNKVIIVGQDKVDAYGFIKACQLCNK